MQSMRSIKLFLFPIKKPNRYAQMSDNLEDVSTESAGIEVISIIHQTNTTDWMMNGIEGWVRRFDSIRWEDEDGQSDISTASRPIRFDLSVSSSTGTFHFILFVGLQKTESKRRTRWRYECLNLRPSTRHAAVSNQRVTKSAAVCDQLSLPIGSMGKGRLRLRFSHSIPPIQSNPIESPFLKISWLANNIDDHVRNCLSCRSRTLGLFIDLSDCYHKLKDDQSVPLIDSIDHWTTSNSVIQCWYYDQHDWNSKSNKSSISFFDFDNGKVNQASRSSTR